MQTIAYSQNVQEFFITPGRTRVALILCQNSKGEFILGKKPSYPEGICRMVGGGIDNNEEPLIGAIRELKEELNLEVNNSDLKELCLINAAFSKGNEQEHLDTFVYYFNIGDLPIAAGDDVTDFAYLNEDGLDKLLSNLKKLTGIYPNDYGKSNPMSWGDWATFHSFILSNAIQNLDTNINAVVAI